MDTDELKKGIIGLLDSTPENVLKEVFNFLKLANDQVPLEIDLPQNLRKILIEDRQLLERLAK